MKNNILEEISFKKKIALFSFILGKLLSLPTAYLIISGSDKSLMFLYIYAFLIISSIVFSIIPDRRDDKEKLPDGVFHLDGITLKISDGKVLDYKITKV
tara:strand:- start:964 stop:1260 length:297 start_codon:yes stop_codon:yes gene_type:complete